jgi:hypothetical protein
MSEIVDPAERNICRAFSFPIRLAIAKPIVTPPIAAMRILLSETKDLTFDVSGISSSVFIVVVFLVIRSLHQKM